MSEVHIAELISKIAHELRSPLTSVKGFSSMLVSRWDRFTDEQRYQFVETIAADAERMSRIVSEVLDLSRMEAGRLELHKVHVPVSTAVAAGVERCKDLPGAERITIEVAEDVTAWADPERLQAIMANLIENAVRFSEEGPIKIAAGDTGDGVWIAVSDEGIGIEPDRLPDIFSGPAGAGGKVTPSGTGLGLYLSRGLIELHGGSITVESVLGRGSTFTMTLPARSDEDG
jgi:signal transduction histidine kinase